MQNALFRIKQSHSYTEVKQALKTDNDNLYFKFCIMKIIYRILNPEK